MENTVKMTDIECIRDSIISAKSHIKNSKNLEWYQIKEIQAREYESRLPHEMTLTNLIDEYFEHALSLIDSPQHH